MRVIKATIDGSIVIVDVDFENMDTIYNEIGGYEVVRTVELLYFFNEPVVMIVDGDGFMKKKNLNYVGSAFYAGDIVGDVLFVPELNGKFVEFDDVDAICVYMNSFF